MSLRIYPASFCLVVMMGVLIRPSFTVIVDKCEKQKNCSLQVDDIYLNCAVGHRAACIEAKTINQQTGRSNSNSSSLLPYLTAMEIYDSSRVAKSFSFKFSIPKSDIGQGGQIFGVLAEFSEHESKNENPYYSHEDPICRYFDFLDSSISKEDIAIHNIKIGYDCIGLDILPSIFVLTLQSVPASFPLVYIISWNHTISSMEYDDYYMDSDYSVWSHRLIAVANVAPPGVALGELQVIFEPARQRVSFYEVKLISEPDGKEVQSRFLQASKLPEKISFKKLRPGHYRVKVEVSDYNCELDPMRCAPLLSHYIVVDSPETRDLVARHNNKTKLLPTLTAILSLVLAAGVVATLLVCVIRCRTRMPCSSHWAKKREKLVINLISLADRRLEELMSEHFDAFLTEALGAEVILSLSFMPRTSEHAENCMSNIQKNGANDEECASPTGSDDPLLHRPIWMTHGNDGRNSRDSIIFTVVLDFFYGSHAMESFGHCDTLSVHQGNDCPTKNFQRLSSELQQAILYQDNSMVGEVLCVTFAHQIAPDSSPSVMSSWHDRFDEMSSYTAGSKSRTLYSDIPVSVVPRKTEHDVSQMNLYNPENNTVTVCGVPQYFLPADIQKLYSKLASSANLSCSDHSLLNSEHSSSLTKALEVYKKAKEQRFHAETFGGTPQSGSIRTLNLFNGCDEES